MKLVVCCALIILLFCGNWHQAKANFLQQGQRNGCPTGYGASRGSPKCFKIYKDKGRSWFEAKKRCRQGGMSLAKPDDAVAISLREDLLKQYGAHSLVWLDGRGDGSRYVGMTRNSPLWSPGQPRSDELSIDWCVYLVVGKTHWMNHRTTPYWNAYCTARGVPGSTLYTLCELEL